MTGQGEILKKYGIDEQKFKEMMVLIDSTPATYFGVCIKSGKCEKTNCRYNKTDEKSQEWLNRGTGLEIAHCRDVQCPPPKECVFLQRKDVQFAQKIFAELLKVGPLYFPYAEASKV